MNPNLTANLDLSALYNHTMIMEESEKQQSTPISPERKKFLKFCRGIALKVAPYDPHSTVSVKTASLNN